MREVLALEESLRFRYNGEQRNGSLHPYGGGTRTFIDMPRLTAH